MEQDKNKQTMFLTSLLIANSDGKCDPKRTMELIRSKITTVINSHEHQMNEDETFGCGRNQANVNPHPAIPSQMFTDPKYFKSVEIKPNNMFMDFAK